MNYQIFQYLVIGKLQHSSVSYKKVLDGFWRIFIYWKNWFRIVICIQSFLHLRVNWEKSHFLCSCLGLNFIFRRVSWLFLMRSSFKNSQVFTIKRLSLRVWKWLIVQWMKLVHHFHFLLKKWYLSRNHYCSRYTN